MDVNSPVGGRATSDVGVSVSQAAREESILYRCPFVKHSSGGWSSNTSLMERPVDWSCSCRTACRHCCVFLRKLWPDFRQWWVEGERREKQSTLFIAPPDRTNVPPLTSPHHHHNPRGGEGESQESSPTRSSRIGFPPCRLFVYL